MATMPIYGKKNFKKFFSRTESPVILTLGMQHQGLEFYKVSTNDDPRLTFDLLYNKIKFGHLSDEWGKLMGSNL